MGTKPPYWQPYKMVSGQGPGFEMRMSTLLAQLMLAACKRVDCGHATWRQQMIIPCCQTTISIWSAPTHKVNHKLCSLFSASRCYLWPPRSVSRCISQSHRQITYLVARTRNFRLRYFETYFFFSRDPWRPFNAGGGVNGSFLWTYMCFLRGELDTGTFRKAGLGCSYPLQRRPVASTLWLDHISTAQSASYSIRPQCCKNLHMYRSH